MFSPRSLRSAALILCAASALLPSKKSSAFSSSPSSSSPKSPDPLAAEIARERATLAALPESDDMFKQVKESVGPALGRAEEALAAGRRMLALQRLAPAFTNVAAAEYLRSLPAATRADAPAFEAEWTRRGSELSVPRANAAAGLKPAAVRALAETALPQGKAFYDASLEYGRSTMVDAGLYYLGSARAQVSFVEFCRALAEAGEGDEPKLRSLAPDIDALEKELLASYVPPASIDRHAEFIAVSASLKEARELDAEGLRYGALLRLLQAALRLAPPPAAPPVPAEIAAGLAAARARLAAGGVDHSIGRIFLESAEGDLEAAAAKPGASPTVAAAIVSKVVPRYFAALAPGPRAPSRPGPLATVTLVRWPYT